jgi:C1A family cysteine protease
LIFIFLKRSGTCKYDSSKSAAKITSYVAVTNGVADENVLTDAIANVGPISVSLYVTANFQLYKSGVFVDSTCPNTVNHAVTLVGYGTLNGQDYYILKNSWGTIWGIYYRNILLYN